MSGTKTPPSAAELRKSLASRKIEHVVDRTVVGGIPVRAAQQAAEQCADHAGATAPPRFGLPERPALVRSLAESAHREGGDDRKHLLQQGRIQSGRLGGPTGDCPTDLFGTEYVAEDRVAVALRARVAQDFGLIDVAIV